MWNHAGAFEGFLEIDVARLGQSNGAAFPVIQNFRRPLVRAVLDEVDPEPAFAPDNIGWIDAELAHLGNKRLGDCVIRRNDGNIARGHAVSSDCYRYVSLSAAESCHELRRLQKALEPWRV